MTRAQALQNRAFLKVLRRTGNVRLAAREVGLKYSTMQDRRRKHPAFAVRWDAALVFFQASFETSTHSALRMKGGNRAGNTPLTLPSPRSRGRVPPSPAASRGEGLRFRTASGEPHLVRLKDGRLQIRRSQAGKLTREAEQAFLAALSATCNVSLAAAAVGACFNSFNRRRKKDPAFAREMRLALRQGYEALEMALLEARTVASHEHDDWRSNEPPAVPPMTVNQALQLMYLHQKAALLVDEPTPLRRRRGESDEAMSERLALMAEARLQRRREAFEVAEAARWERGEPAHGLAGEDVRRELGLACHTTPHPPTASRRVPPSPPGGEGLVVLPDLAQVTGWSRADPKAPHDPTRALFGGWRIEDLEARRRG